MTKGVEKEKIGLIGGRQTVPKVPRGAISPLQQSIVAVVDVVSISGLCVSPYCSRVADGHHPASVV